VLAQSDPFKWMTLHIIITDWTISFLLKATGITIDSTSNVPHFPIGLTNVSNQLAVKDVNNNNNSKVSTTRTSRSKYRNK